MEQVAAEVYTLLLVGRLKEAERKLYLFVAEFQARMDRVYTLANERFHSYDMHLQTRQEIANLYMLWDTRRQDFYKAFRNSQMTKEHYDRFISQLNTAPVIEQVAADMVRRNEFLQQLDDEKAAYLEERAMRQDYRENASNPRKRPQFEDWEAGGTENQEP